MTQESPLLKHTYPKALTVSCQEGAALSHHPNAGELAEDDPNVEVQQTEGHDKDKPNKPAGHNSDMQHDVYRLCGGGEYV
jgi:hypothetical protein